jgi:hypothetical protein
MSYTLLDQRIDFPEVTCAPASPIIPPEYMVISASLAPVVHVHLFHPHTCLASPV